MTSTVSEEEFAVAADVIERRGKIIQQINVLARLTAPRRRPKPDLTVILISGRGEDGDDAHLRRVAT
jgi:hypothetical protein